MSEFSFRKILIPAYGPSLLFGIGYGAILPVIVISAQQHGASVALAALMSTFIAVASLVTNIPASAVTSKFGEKWAIVAAAGWSTLAMALALFTGGLWTFIAAMVMVGMSNSVFNLARQSYLTEAVPFHFRARALSTLGGVLRIGVFIGPVIGAGVITLMGTDGAYVVALVAIGAATLLALTLPELDRDTRIRNSVDPSRGGAPVQEPQARVTVMDIARRYRRVFFTVGIGIMAIGAVRASRQVVIPLWGSHLGLDDATISLVYAAVGFIDMAVFYPAGRAMDKRGRLFVAVPCLLIMGLAMLALPLTTGLVAYALVSMIIGFGNGLGSGIVMTFGADYSPTFGRPQFLALWRLQTDVGALAGPAVISAVTAAVSLGAGIASAGVFGLIGAAALWYFVPRTPPARFHAKT